MDVSYSTALQDYYASERKTLATEAAVCAELQALGVVVVFAEYDGVGDSGQIEQLTYFSTADRSTSIDIPEPISTRVENLLYALLNLRHGGWENNDGACGTFEWDLNSELIEHEHNARYTDCYTSNYQGFAIDAEKSP